MNQKFIELGEGTSDLYELIDIGDHMAERVKHVMTFATIKKAQPVVSLALVLEPSGIDKFQPIYICREGVPDPEEKKTQRYEMFEALAERLEKSIIPLTVKPSDEFYETALYYQHLIGILRMNRYIPPMS
ncbi:hypothetical protein SAMN05421743_12312 [Thalassobacillus cyri]|uniref:DUF7147 domain-containing protein n=1 Tax=Thalassobacillus cyri TaxID=571932 RepID=A0A1H4H678_9BACI|nr:methylthioribose kinase [Thalassobacillus cyri]SEB17141.1 hypothetical protein SAMN05421743_12312 [Thalassobacillus cyri]